MVPQGTNAFHSGEKHKDWKLYSYVYFKQFYALILCLQESRVLNCLLCATTVKMPASDICKSTVNCTCLYAWALIHNALNRISNKTQTKRCQRWGWGGIIRQGQRARCSPSCRLPQALLIDQRSLMPQGSPAAPLLLFLFRLVSPGHYLSPEQPCYCWLPSCEKQAKMRTTRAHLSLAHEQTLNRNTAPQIYL